MASLSLDEILERVNELKQESTEKDEVIRVQQTQIQDLENKVRDLDQQNIDLENQIAEMNESAKDAQSMLEKLSSVLE